jgi:hypothetical protein
METAASPTTTNAFGFVPKLPVREAFPISYSARR